jgi:hypothetical protein
MLCILVHGAQRMAVVQCDQTRRCVSRITKEKQKIITYGSLSTTFLLVADQHKTERDTYKRHAVGTDTNARPCTRVRGRAAACCSTPYPCTGLCRRAFSSTRDLLQSDIEILDTSMPLRVVMRWPFDRAASTRLVVQPEANHATSSSISVGES